MVFSCFEFEEVESVLPLLRVEEMLIRCPY